MDAICFKYIYLHLVKNFRGTFSDRVSGGMNRPFPSLHIRKFLYIGVGGTFSLLFLFRPFFAFPPTICTYTLYMILIFWRRTNRTQLAFCGGRGHWVGRPTRGGWVVGAMMKEYFQRGTKTHVSSPGIKNSFSSSAAVLVGTACPAQGHFLSGEEGPRRDSEGEDDDARCQHTTCVKR